MNIKNVLVKHKDCFYPVSAKTQNAHNSNLYYLTQTCPIPIRSTLTLINIIENDLDSLCYSCSSTEALILKILLCSLHMISQTLLQQNSSLPELDCMRFLQQVAMVTASNRGMGWGKGSPCDPFTEELVAGGPLSIFSISHTFSLTLSLSLPSLFPLPGQSTHPAQLYTRFSRAKKEPDLRPEVSRSGAGVVLCFQKATAKVTGEIRVRCTLCPEIPGKTDRGYQFNIETVTLDGKKTAKSSRFLSNISSRRIFCFSNCNNSKTLGLQSKAEAFSQKLNYGHFAFLPLKIDPPITEIILLCWENSYLIMRLTCPYTDAGPCKPAHYEYKECVSKTQGLFLPCLLNIDPAGILPT
eukprot:sb/3466138/